MVELSRAEIVARYLKSIPNLTKNQLYKYCEENNINNEEIKFIELYINNRIIYSL